MNVRKQAKMSTKSDSSVTFESCPVSHGEKHVTTGGIMTSSTRIPEAELTGLYGALVKRMSRKMFGEVPQPVGVTWHNRKVLNFSFAAGRKAQKWNRCDENLKSFAHMATASLIGCSFCLDLGYFFAHNEGLDVNKAREVPRWRVSDVFTPLERDVMEYAEAMTQTPPTVTDELSARLLQALGPAALVELTAFIALANFMARSNVAMGIESQEFSVACDLKPLALASSA
jgi:alkylhydroperoxidase family enzyme